MTDYRVVARHIRYWRGVPKKWSTVWELSGNIGAADYGNVITAVHDLEQGVNYKGPAGILGGLYQVALYDVASGGVPIQTATYFDESSPGNWLAYTGSYWPSNSVNLEPQAEVTLDVKWLAGLSSSGKPVAFRKFFHAVPVSGASGANPDLVTATQTALQGAINNQMAVIGGYGAPLGNSRRLAATTCLVDAFYGNHQMPRGRRRKPLVTASGTYTGPTIRVPVTAN